MQVIIDISEETYNDLCKIGMFIKARSIDEVVDAVKNGIVSPHEIIGFESNDDGTTTISIEMQLPEYLEESGE